MLVIGATAVLLLRPSDRSPEARIGLYLGETAAVAIAVDGAPAGTVEWLDPVVLEELGVEDGVPSVRIRLTGMEPAANSAAEAQLWIPLDRIAEVRVGPVPIYRAR